MTFSCDAATFGSYPTDFLVAAGKIRTIFSLLAKSQMSRSTWVNCISLVSLSPSSYSVSVWVSVLKLLAAHLFANAPSVKLLLLQCVAFRLPFSLAHTHTYKCNCFGCKKRVPVACSRHRVFFLVFFVFLFPANFLSWFMWRGRDVICNKGS